MGNGEAPQGGLSAGAAICTDDALRAWSGGRLASYRVAKMSVHSEGYRYMRLQRSDTAAV